MIGLRNYDLATILPAIQAIPTSLEQTANVKYVFEKLAKRSGLTSSDLNHLKELSSNTKITEENRKFVRKQHWQSKAQ
ncbi:MAG: hypothetical protein H7A42_01945 [Chlamydiales bacterium]|nr:hypothetical protein [Chlamydiales bacterium]